MEEIGFEEVGVEDLGCGSVGGEGVAAFAGGGGEGGEIE